MNDLLGGRLDCSLDVTAMAINHIAAGTLRPLAVSSNQRLEELPNVPTFEEERLGRAALFLEWNLRSHRHAAGDRQPLVHGAQGHHRQG